MGPLVDVAPSADTVPLSRAIADRIRQSVRTPRARSRFERLRGSVALVALDAGVALTLRFDFGRLVVHGGVIGVPDVTVRGPMHVLEGFGQGETPSLRSWLPERPFGSPGARSGLTVYGFITHPLLVHAVFSLLRGGER